MGICIYPTPQSLQEKVDEYFEQCFVEEYNKKYDRFIKHCIEPPTFSGLARYLGFNTRQSLLRYQNKGNPLYEDVINDAKLRIEEFYEGKLVTTKGNPSGLMFALKNNAGWEDQTKLVGADGNNNLVISWDPEAKDVIDAQVVNPELVAPKKEAPKEVKQEVKEEEEEWTVIASGC